MTILLKNNYIMFNYIKHYGCIKEEYIVSENRIICTCQDVDYDTIKKAIQDGAKTVDDIMEATGAGTVCGACIDEIEEIIQEVEE